MLSMVDPKLQAEYKATTRKEERVIANSQPTSTEPASSIDLVESTSTVISNRRVTFNDYSYLVPSSHVTASTKDSSLSTQSSRTSMIEKSQDDSKPTLLICISVIQQEPSDSRFGRERRKLAHL